MGASGSGKSTLMNIVGCLDRPTTGSYRLDGVEVSRAEPRRSWPTLRNRTLGFVFQSFNLLPRTTALENVELPLLYGGVPRARAARGARARRSSAWGSATALRPPPERAVGRPAAARGDRARAGRQPQLVLADEPTGNLDSRDQHRDDGAAARAARRGITWCW